MKVKYVDAGSLVTADACGSIWVGSWEDALSWVASRGLIYMDVGVAVVGM